MLIEIYFYPSTSRPVKNMLGGTKRSFRQWKVYSSLHFYIEYKSWFIKLKFTLFN